MPFEPVSPLGGFTGVMGVPERAATAAPDESVWDAAFRTENTIGSSLASQEVRTAREQVGVLGGPVRIDPDFDPWAEIVDTPYEAYTDQFAVAGNKDHFEAIKADIDREAKDRDTIARSGLTGIGASMAAGVLDLPILLPGGNIIRSAKGGISLLRTAGSTAAYGTAAAAASEGALQASQQLRTGTESAAVIGGSTVLAGLLGAGFGKLFSRAEQAALASRIETDFRVPGVDESDPFIPGGVRVDAATGASEKAASVADIIRQTAEEILPPQVRVKVQDSIDLPKTDAADADGLFALRGFYSPAIRAAEGISQAKGTGEQFWKQITKVGGVRKDELEWMGLEEFLKGKPSVTKAEVLDYMRAHQVELDEKVLGPESRYSGKTIDEAIALIAREERTSTDDVIENYGYVDREEYAQLAAARYGFEGDPDAEMIGAKFSGHKVPGGENYRELLIRLPSLERGGNPYAGLENMAGGVVPDAPAYVSKHFQDQEIVHLRVDDRVGPNGEKVLFINEVQSDLHQAGRTTGYRDRGHNQRLVAAEQELQSAELKYNAASAKLREIEASLPPHGDPARVEADRARDAAHRDWLSAMEKHEKIEAEISKLETSLPNAPFKGNLWLELALKRALLYASENGYDAVSWARSDQIARAVGAQPEGLKLQYDSKIGKFLDKYTKKWGGKVEHETAHPYAVYRRPDGTFSVETRGDQLVPMDREGVLHVTNTKDEALDIFNELVAAYRPDGNQFLRITPEMRASVMEGQPLSVRQAPEGITAEGRFDPQNLLITISANALDPVKTLKHEGIHALRTMGLFTSKEWGTLEAAAKKQGWVESNNVRGLYEDIYSGRTGDGQFSLAAKANKSPITLKAVRADDMPEGMRLFEIHQSGELQPGFINGNINPRDPKDLVIASIAMPGSSNSLGDANVREILRQIKKAYPELETVSGTRLTGARQAAGVPVSQSSARLRLPTARDAKFSLSGEGRASTGPVDPKLENLLLEEAIAEQFSLWRQGAKNVTGTIAKLFERIQQFLDRLGNALRGQGFQTADDVFASVRGGDVAGRATPTSRSIPAGGAFAAGSGRATSVGAAGREVVDNTLKPALGLETVRIDPLIYLQNSKSEKSRAYVQELAETPLAFKKNAEGYETAPLGSEMGEPGAVESRIKGWQAPLAESVAYTENAFMRYRKGRNKLPLDQLRTTISDAISAPEKLTWRQFKEEVSKASRRGDEHEIPEVAQAAKFARKSVFDALKNRAIDKELLPEDISAETAASYLNRMYNKEKIIARRPEFRDIVRQWLDEVEFRNGVTRRQLSPLLKRLDELQDAAKKEAAKKPKTGKKPVDPEEAELRAAQAAEDKAEMTELQKQIEDLVLKYEGKTKAEAEIAVKAREKAEATREPGSKRLTAADKPIIRAARKIAAQTDKEAGETTSLADEIIDRILGTPDGRLPYDAHLNRTTNAQGVSSSARGPLAAREFMIPDQRIEDFLENDFELLMNAYVRTMAPDVELHARFGDVDMKLQFKEIQDDWARKASAAKTEKERRSLHAQRDGDMRRLAAIRDRLRGTYALPSNPDGLMLRTGRVMRSSNYMAMLGGQLISAIPDMGSIVFSHGIMRTFGDGIIPLFRNFSGTRLAAREVKLAGTALDMVLDSRAMNIGEIMDDYGRHTKFERGVQSLTRNFGPVSLMSPWNATLKQIAGIITMSRIIRAADALARGKISKPELERLAASGISRDNALKIAEQFKKHGEKEGGVFLPHTENWDASARAAKEAFRVALVREVDKTIITPGQEKFLWMSTELGKTLGQFKSFSVSANQRLLIAGLQQRDLSTLSGAALMVALGGLVHILKTKASGREPGIDWNDNEKTSQLMVNAVDRSGLLGWLMEANAVTEKLTGGQVGLSALTGRPISRYASRNVVGALAGPTFGTLQSIGQVSSAGFTQWNETDTRAARRLIPYQNLFYLRSLFDKAESGINGFFGVPKTATRH